MQDDPAVTPEDRERISAEIERAINKAVAACDIQGMPGIAVGILFIGEGATIKPDGSEPKGFTGLSYSLVVSTPGCTTQDETERSVMAAATMAGLLSPISELPIEFLSMIARKGRDRMLGMVTQGQFDEFKASLLSVSTERSTSEPN